MKVTPNPSKHSKGYLQNRSLIELSHGIKGISIIVSINSNKGNERYMYRGSLLSCKQGIPHQAALSQR